MDVLLCILNQIIAVHNLYHRLKLMCCCVATFLFYLHSVVIARLWHQFGEQCYVVIYGFHTEVLLQYYMYIVYISYT